MAAALIALAVPNVASAQVIPGLLNVTTTKDGNDGECSKDCTLREAVAVAGEGEPVLLPAGVYKLTQGPLAIVKSNTAIYGAGLGSQQSAGARTTIIDGNNAGRVVTVSPGGTVVFAGVTLTGGREASGAGAFVSAASSMFLYNSTVRDNVATGRGGGITAAGTLYLIQSTVSDNRAAAGGGIAVESNGFLYAPTSTITDNTGGAIATSGTYQLINSTISGGLTGEPGSSGSAQVVNTILAGPGPACAGNVAATPHSGWTGNLASDATCALVGAEGTVADPQLGALRNNRGATDTRALQANSPAINNGSSGSCPGNDQRGAAAVGNCDKGAFEFGGQVPEAQLPPPVPGETVNASRSRGTVRGQAPRQRRVLRPAGRPAAADGHHLRHQQGPREPRLRGEQRAGTDAEGVVLPGRLQGPSEQGQQAGDDARDGRQAAVRRRQGRERRGQEEEEAAAVG